MIPAELQPHDINCTPTPIVPPSDHCADSTWNYEPIIPRSPAKIKIYHYYSAMLVSRLLRPRLRVSSVRLQPSTQTAYTRLFSTAKGLLAQLPNTHIFRALREHDPSSLAVVHSLSGQSFTYGNLTADVLRAKEDLDHKAAETKGKLSGERVAFMAENSYDYVGAYFSFLPSFLVSYFRG